MYTKIVNFLYLFVIIAFIINVFYYCVFAIAVVRKRNDIADIAWGMGFILVALIGLVLMGNVSDRYLLTFFLVLLWGARLGTYIFFRNRKKGEDWRYQAWRKKWGKWWEIWAYLHVFLVQAWLLLIVAVPIIWLAAYGWQPLNYFDYLAVIIWTTGFLFESLGDYQLSRFKANPKNRGQVMQTGLWAYTRHPNYFGEFLMWWRIIGLTLSVPEGLMTIVGPMTITYLLTRVSGIPMLEKKYANNPDYQDYQRRVSPFVPLPPKK